MALDLPKRTRRLASRLRARSEVLAAAAIILWIMGMLASFTLNGFLHVLPLIALGITIARVAEFLALRD